MTSTVLPMSTSDAARRAACARPRGAGRSSARPARRWSAGVPLLQLGGELDALRLAARQRGRRLAQPHVPQPDLHQRAQPPGDPLDRREELGGLLDRHVEDLADRLALVAHLERVPVVPGPVAHLAGDVDVRQEVHPDPDRALALAALAPPALHVEREPARLVAADLRLGRLREQLADVVEHPGVRGRVRPRGPADRRLVDADHLVDLPGSRDPGVPAPRQPRPVELVRQRRVQDVADQRRLARPGHAGDRHEQPSGNATSMPRRLCSRAPSTTSSRPAAAAAAAPAPRSGPARTGTRR